MTTPGSSDGGTSMFSANGLVALITGGGTGIGLMMAKALAEAGAQKVYIVGRRAEVLQQAAASLNGAATTSASSSSGAVVVPLTCDVTSTESLEALVAAVSQDAGYLNLLVCNSGVGGPAPSKALTAETTLDEWRDEQLAVPRADYDRTFEVNCSSVWYTAVACLKLLDEGNKRGNVDQSSQVVVTGSVAAFNRLAPGGWAYGQSKVAATHVVKQLAAVLPRWGVRANCIAPGLFPSEMSAPIVQRATQGQGGGGGGGGLGWEEGKPIPIGRESVPLGRMGDGVDMAGAILYLASRAGGYCNGNIMLVDGGRLTTFPSTGY